MFLSFTLRERPALADEQPSHAPEYIAATVNGERITTAELEATVRAQVEPLQRQIEQLREAALQKLIDNLLIKQAAEAEGKTVEV